VPFRECQLKIVKILSFEKVGGKQEVLAEEGLAGFMVTSAMTVFQPGWGSLSHF
jgi:hypothetical protein